MKTKVRKVYSIKVGHIVLTYKQFIIYSRTDGGLVRLKIVLWMVTLVFYHPNQLRREITRGPIIGSRRYI